MDRLVELALAVKAVHRELERWVNEAMRPLGVTAAQADALSVIALAQPVSLKELGDLLVAESGHPSRLVDRLVEAGLVARRPADEDRRRIVLTTTPSGSRLVRRINEVRADLADAAGATLGDEDLDAAMRLADALLAESESAQIIERRRALETRRVNRAGPRR